MALVPFLLILAIFPNTALVNTTVYANSVTLVIGNKISGSLSSFYYADGWEYKVNGWEFIVYEINYYVDFPNSNPGGDDPYLDMKVYFIGGDNIKITISYYDGSSDVLYVTKNGYSYWFWYALDAGKTVQRIRWENLEWWFPSQVWVDVSTVFYD